MTLSRSTPGTNGNGLIVSGNSGTKPPGTKKKKKKNNNKGTNLKPPSDELLTQPLRLMKRRNLASRPLKRPPLTRCIVLDATLRIIRRGIVINRVSYVARIMPILARISPRPAISPTRPRGSLSIPTFSKHTHQTE